MNRLSEFRLPQRRCFRGYPRAVPVPAILRRERKEPQTAHL